MANPADIEPEAGLLEPWPHFDTTAIAIQADGRRRWSWLALVAALILAPLSGAVSLWLLAPALIAGLLWIPLIESSNRLHDLVRAAEKLNSLRSALRSPKKYVLLLRSFRSSLVVERRVTTRVTKVKRTKLIRGELFEFDDWMNSEELISDQISDMRRFLSTAVGTQHVVTIDGDSRSMEHTPVGILSLDNNWWRIFVSLVENAQAILIIPEASSSLADEIRYLLASSRLPDCLFVMPPSVIAEANRPDITTTGATRMERWESCRKQLPIQLPEYDATGAILLYKSTGQVQQRMPLTSQCLRAALEERSASGTALKFALRELVDERLYSYTADVMRRRIATVHAAIGRAGHRADA